MPAIEKLHSLTDEQRRRLSEGNGEDVLHVWKTQQWQLAMRMVEYLGLSLDNVPDFALALQVATAEYMTEGYMDFKEFARQAAARTSDVQH